MSMANEDLISRAAATAEVEQWAEHGHDVIHWTGIKAMLEIQPAVDAVPVVYGEWKWSHGGECSECGFHNSNFDYLYCPMCGAKMYGGPDA